MNKICNRCSAILTTDNGVKNRLVCKKCLALYLKQWKIKNVHFVNCLFPPLPKDMLIERRRIARQKWKDRNPEAHKKCQKKYEEKNKAKSQQRVRERQARKLNATPKWANRFFIEEAYSLADLRSKLFGFKWEVDHIVPLQSTVVCGLHCEANLRVIPRADNRRKGNKYWPDMP